jgi:hypothetical protein
MHAPSRSGAGSSRDALSLATCRRRQPRGLRNWSRLTSVSLSVVSASSVGRRVRVIASQRVSPGSGRCPSTSHASRGVSTAFRFAPVLVSKRVCSASQSDLDQPREGPEISGLRMVGVAGFEPTASSSRKPRARSHGFRIVSQRPILRGSRVLRSSPGRTSCVPSHPVSLAIPFAVA